jgi:uncharacterized protein (TIGR03067 family)
MRLLASLALSLALVATLGARAAEEKDPAKALQGEWTITDWRQGGATVPLAELSTIRWAVDGTRYAFALGDSREEGTVKVDAAKKPATIDLAIADGESKGQEQLGIYKFDGDAIVICFGRPGTKDRPTEFSSTRANRQILMTIKRAKKAG